MKRLILFLLVLSLVLMPTKVLAWDLVELGEVTLEHKMFTYANTLPLGVNREANTQTDLKLGITLLGNGYMRNVITSMTDSSQYRLVGWNWEFGVRLTDWTEVGWWHFSKHGLDMQDAALPSGTREDGVIIRFKLNKGVQPDGIF